MIDTSHDELLRNFGRILVSNIANALQEGGALPQADALRKYADGGISAAIAMYRDTYPRTQPDPAKLVETLEATTEMCVQYAGYIRDHVKSDDLELHPYLPSLEQSIEDGQAALAAWKGTGQ